MIRAEENGDIRRSVSWSGPLLPSQRLTANEIQIALLRVDKLALKKHFKKTNHRYFVCTCEEEEWLKFSDTIYDNESSTFRLRFCEFRRGIVQINDMVVSREHARTVSTFVKIFTLACGNALEFSFNGDFTSNRMEPDWSCGPINPTMPVQIGLIGVSYWRTFILEVGFAQSQNLLNEKAES